MTRNEHSTSGPQLRSGPLITGAALGAAGALLTLAGLAVSGTHLLAATRRWVRELDLPPSELARLKWAQARAAAAAGSQAWQRPQAPANQRTRARTR